MLVDSPFVFEVNHKIHTESHSHGNPTNFFSAGPITLDTIPQEQAFHPREFAGFPSLLAITVQFINYSLLKCY